MKRLTLHPKYRLDFFILEKTVLNISSHVNHDRYICINTCMDIQPIIKRNIIKLRVVVVMIMF